MNYRELGRTGWKVSDISFGAWAIGGVVGHGGRRRIAGRAEKAIECGVNFIDTADVYGMGRSERLIAQLQARAQERDRRRDQGGPAPLAAHRRRLQRDRISAAFIEDSLRNLATDCLDLVQLHCPPTDVYYRPEVFGALDRLMEAGKIRYYGVSVERVEEALKAIEYPNVQTVQIIFNCFRQRPADLFFEEASAEAGRDSGARSAGERDADGKLHARLANSPPTTIASSTATARRSTWARRSPAWITKRAWMRWRKCAACCPRA